MALAGDLLSLAKFLVNPHPDLPERASLRRAVSTAYYSLFHLLIDEAAGQFFDVPEKLRAIVQRAFNHSDMRKLCEEMARPVPKNSLGNVLAEPINAKLRNVAKTFVELQDSRHLADYDVSEPFDAIRARLLLDRAEEAFSDWEDEKDSTNAKVFLAALLLNRHWKR
jgi:hypothetical protein